jgi:hypothetical protein
MANQRLFRSALVCGFIHFLAIAYWNGPTILLIIYGFGAGTSIWNHGVTSEYAKWADRMMMAVGALMDMLWILAYTNELQRCSGLSMLACAVGLYFLEKLNSFRKWPVPQDFLHQSSHYLITINHLFLLYFLSS